MLMEHDIQNRFGSDLQELLDSFQQYPPFCPRNIDSSYRWTMIIISLRNLTIPALNSDSPKR